MKPSARVWKAAAALAVVAVLLAAAAALKWGGPWWAGPSLPPGVQEFPGPIVQTGGYSLSGPYAHENLAVFLVHGEDRLHGLDFLTLREALEQKKAVVYETGQVNELSVENLSPGETLYVQSGDIVKGGQQDRVLDCDLIVSPRSGRIPLDAYCVESGRWAVRGAESGSSFSDSYAALPSKGLKLAAKYERSQQQVWAKVHQMQARLQRNVPSRIVTASDSSLQLTLESPSVQESVGPYLKALRGAADGKDDVVGFAYAVNGKVNSAEVYASRFLFRKLWPKLLEASAVEALSERRPDERFAPVGVEAVRDFLADAEGGKASVREVGERVQQVVQETDRGLLFETRDRQQGGAWVHRGYLTK
jgi:hypothetical protein